MSQIMIQKKNRIFLAYPFTEFYEAKKIPELTNQLAHIAYAISQGGIYTVKSCSIFDEELFKQMNLTWPERYKITQEQVKECGRFVGFVPTDVVSEGRDNEALESCERGFPIHMIVKTGVDWQKTHPKLLNKIGDSKLVDIIEYDNVETDLYRKLKTYDFV